MDDAYLPAMAAFCSFWKKIQSLSSSDTEANWDFWAEKCKGWDRKQGALKILPDGAGFPSGRVWENIPCASGQTQCRHVLGPATAKLPVLLTRTAPPSWLSGGSAHLSHPRESSITSPIGEMAFSWTVGAKADHWVDGGLQKTHILAHFHHPARASKPKTLSSLNKRFLFVPKPVLGASRVAKY